MKRYMLFSLALLLVGCAGAPPATQPVPAASTQVTCPVGFPSAEQLASWKTRVETAQAMTDSIEKRDAMVELVREALGPDVQVRLAGNASPGMPHPDDYVPFPAVNFDMNLGDKRDANTGYFFSVGDRVYVVLGPGSIHPRGPITTQHNAQHEMYHAQHHVGDARPMLDREVEVWTHIFTNTFHHDYPHKMLWNPLMSSYENASPAEKQIALHRLVNYYKSPPARIDPACVLEFREEFAGWVSRRLNDEKGRWKQLPQDLSRELALPAATASQGGN